MLISQNSVFLKFKFNLNSKGVCFVTMKKRSVWSKNRLTGQNVWINLMYFASWYLVYIAYPGKLGQNFNVEILIVGKSLDYSN